MTRRKIDFKNPAEHRKSMGLNQSEYWAPYDVTQSGGSRYEAGRTMPTQVAALMWLTQNGHISPQLLEQAVEAANAGLGTKSVQAQQKALKKAMKSLKE